MYLIKNATDKIIDSPLGSITISFGTISFSLAQLFELVQSSLGIVGVLIGISACWYTFKYNKTRYEMLAKSSEEEEE